MKKLLVVLIIALFFSSFLFAETIGTDDLTVYGMIPAGAKLFTVTQTNTDTIDLLSALVSPTGNGHVLGEWEYNATNQTAEGLTVTYTYDALSDGAATPALIPFVLLEYASGSTTGGVPRNSSATTGFTTTDGNYTTARDIGFRLTNDGQTAALGAADGSYQSTITITLTTNL